MPQAAPIPAPEIDSGATVASLVTEQPGRSRVFERLQIDYCCGGGVPLEQAVADAGLDLREVLAQLAEADAGPAEERDWSQASISDLCEHIVEVHHGYLRDALPRLSLLVAKVARAHGDSRPELVEVRRVFERAVDELVSHLEAEEQDMFPLLATRETRAGAGDELAELVGELEGEHHEVADALRVMRRLLDDYQVPDGACTSYRAMLAGLEELERDMHRHVHEENNVLFPRVMEELYAAG